MKYSRHHTAKSPVSPRDSSSRKRQYSPDTRSKSRIHSNRRHSCRPNSPRYYTVNSRPRPATTVTTAQPSAKRPTVLGRSQSSQNYWSHRSLKSFEIITKIGEGAYGQVYKARDKLNSELVALKKIEVRGEEGFPIHAIRELDLLRKLRHQNIISLTAIVTGENESFYLCLELMQYDVRGLLRMGHCCSESDEASILWQVLNGLKYCHRKHIIHRDIKTSNILVNTRGEVKLADFGLARQYDVDNRLRPYTNNVVSLWYRPPELLLGEERYGSSIDIWSCGAVLGELFLKKALFPSNNEVEQLDTISRTCGSLTPAVWPSVIKMPLFNVLKPKQSYRRRLRDDFIFMPASELDLLDKMLQLDPDKRITAEDALKSAWFTKMSPDQLVRVKL